MLDEFIDAFLNEYSCYECGTAMEQVGDVLVCPKCGHSVDVDDYITEEEDYDRFYGINRYDDDDMPEEIRELYEDIYDDD